MILYDLREVLLPYSGEQFFFGMETKKVQELQKYDYMVLRQVGTSICSKGTSVAEKFELEILREQHVDPLLILKAIRAVKSIAGVHVPDQDVEHKIFVKQGTNAIVDSATVVFTRSYKASEAEEHGR